MASAPALDYSRLPAFGLPAPDDDKSKNKGILGPGLKSGLRDLESVLGSAVQGGGKLFGSDSVAAFGKGINDSASAASAAAGRPDLEIAPWHAGGAPVLPWLGYQAAKQVPMLAAYLAGGKGYAVAGGEAPAELERLSAFAPRALGGGGLRAGADFATRRAGIDAGKEFAQQLTGGAVAGLPIAFGSMIQEADNKPGGVTAKDAMRAAALSPFYSALDAAEPAQFKGLLARGLEGNIIKRVATAAFVGAAMEVPQEGIQTAMEQSFRPDLSVSEKMSNIVDAAVSGGAVGAIFGGAAGTRALKRADASSIPTEDLASAVDAMLQLPSPRTVQQQAPASNEQVAVGPDGQGAAEVSPFDFKRSEFDTPAPRRPYEGASSEELTKGLGAAQKAIDAGTASDNVLRFAEAAKQELQARNDSSTTGAVTDETSRGGEPQAEATTGKPEGDGGTDSGAPAPATDWNSERGTLLKGVSTRQRYTDVQSREDLTAAVRARLENGSSAAGDFKLAERLGIDTNASAAPVETAPKSTTDQTTKAATVTTETKPDEKFVAQWKDDVQKLGQRDKGARSIKPVNEADAQQQIYQALGKNTEIGDGLEKLAQKYGILDEDKKLTPLAVSIAQKEAIPAETVDKAARAQGLMGTSKEMFSSGVQAQLGGEQITKFDNHPDFAAYSAGAKWAEEHNSVPQGALTKYDPKAQLVGDVTDEQVAQINSTTPAQPRTVSDEAKAKQSANIAIDNAVSPTTQASDLAHLKSLVRQGDVKGAMEGLKRVQAGESLFQQPATEQKPFKGETVTRGAPRTGESTVELQPTRGASRAAAEMAIRKHEVTQAVHAAHAEGAIDNKERIRLLSKLNQGRVADVAAAIPTKFTGEKALRTTSLTQRTAQREAVRQKLADLWQQVEAESEDPKELSVDRNGVLRAARFQGVITDEHARYVQSQLEGKTALEVADLLIAAAPNNFQNRVADKTRSVMKFLTKAGMTFEFKVVRAGDIAPMELTEARGLTVDDADNDITTIYINGIDGPGPTGLSYEVVMHEMLHAVTMQSIGYIQATGKYSSPLGKAVQDLHAVTDAIQAHLSNRLKQGNLTKMEQFIVASNAAENPDETLAWALSSPEFQSYLDTIDYTPRETLWGHFVNAMRTFLGLGASGNTALVEVLRTSEQIMSVGPQELELAALSGYREAMMRTPGEAIRTNDTAQKVVKAISDHVPIESATNATRKMVLGWNSIGHMVAHYTKQFPQLALYSRAHLERRATQARWSQLFEAPYQVYEKLERTDPKAATNIRYLMSLTQFSIDPTKAWDQHDHLKGSPNEARLKELTEDANRKYNLLRGKGQAKVYDDFRAINEATHVAMMSVSLHNLVVSDPVLREGMTGFETDPTDTFRESAALHESPQNARSYWQEQVDGQVRRAEEYIAKLRGDTVGSAAEQRVASMRLEPIEMRIRSIRESLNAMRDAPYFHLGRHGDHFVSFTLRTGEDKNVDQAAIDHAGKVIEAAGFSNIEISRDQTRPNVYIRVESIEARQQLESIVRKMQADGYLKPDTEIKAAPRSTSGDTGTADQAPAWLERYIELLQASPMFEPTDNMSAADKAALSSKKAQMVSHARELWLDMLPDTAIAKVMVHRNSVPGFDKDMVRNFAFRFQVGVNSLANLSASAKLNDAFTQMRAAVFDAQVAGHAEHANVDLKQSLLSEVLVREAQRPLIGGASWVDTFRAINHAFFLGFSPSYVLVNTTQLGVLLWPELAKTHGFTKSASAIGSVTKTAFNIMKETLAAGARVGPKRALDAVITEDVLRKAGVDEHTAAFLMKVIAEGWIDIGGSSRELGRVADATVASHLNTGLRWAAAFGLYSETFTRLVAALAARKLNGSNETAYPRQVTEQSMLNYSDWNTARQMGKMGFAGPMTKVMTAFMQYNAQVLEKLYREFHTGIVDKTSTPAEKVAARRFLAGHLTAVTALAGTLGLPFATVAATVIEKLVDLFDDDDTPYDATASWRNFLSSILGPGIGEMAARGLPRAGGEGFDFSQRAGEQNLLPFTQFLTDKRKWQDASSEAALRSAGAPVSMVLNVFEGGEQISNGNVMGGMTQMLPMSLKGPAQAYRMTTDGYIDANGNKLPMTPKATAILGQLVGLTPQAKAEYSEARGDQASREGVLVNRAKVLRSNIADAVLSGDHDAARDLIRQAKAFDTANPAFAVLPDIENTIAHRLKAQAISQATQTPIGVNPKDKAGRQLTGYANIEFARQ